MRPFGGRATLPVFLLGLVIAASLLLSSGCSSSEDDSNPDTDTIGEGVVDGLLAWWKLDEATGSTAADAVGDWDLSAMNDPAWATGHLGGAMDATTTEPRYLERTGIATAPSSAWSLAAWVRRESDAVEAMNIMGLNSGAYATNAGAAEIKLYLTSTYQLVASYHSTDAISGPMLRISGGTISRDTWHHVVGVVSGGDIQMYIDGVLDEATAVTSPDASALTLTNGRATVANARLYEGAYLSNRWFRGKVDEAAVWNRALSADEVEWLYATGVGRAFPF